MADSGWTPLGERGPRSLTFAASGALVFSFSPNKGISRYGFRQIRNKSNVQNYELIQQNRVVKLKNENEKAFGKNLGYGFDHLSQLVIKYIKHAQTRLCWVPVLTLGERGFFWVC